MAKSSPARQFIVFVACISIAWGATDEERIRAATGELRTAYAKAIDKAFNRADSQPIPLAPDRKAAVERELRSIILNGIARLLASGGDSTEALTAGIRAIQDTPSAVPGASDYTNLPFADRFQLNGSPGAAISYFGGTLYAPPYLEFYVATGGRWELKSSVGEEFERSTFFVSRLPSPLAGQAWYLTWGHQIGDTGTRLKLRLYAFNGSDVRTVWARDGLTHGEVRVSSSTVTLEYDKIYNVPESRVAQTLLVTPNGLE